MGKQGERVSSPAVVPLPVDQGECVSSPAVVPVNQGDARVGAKPDPTEGAELAPSESEGAPPLKRKWLLRRKKVLKR